MSLTLRILIFLDMIFLVIDIWLGFGGLHEITKTNGKNMESLAALFSGLAFMGMIVAIALQSNELGLQRKELEETRAELKRTAEANEKSAKLAKENLQQQEKIAKINNSYTKNQILAQKYIAQINNMYKKIEYFSECNPPNYTPYMFGEIEKLLDKLERLKILDDPLSEDSPSTPEA